MQTHMWLLLITGLIVLIVGIILIIVAITNKNDIYYSNYLLVGIVFCVLGSLTLYVGYDINNPLDF